VGSTPGSKPAAALTRSPPVDNGKGEDMSAMCEMVKNWGPVAGRVLLALIFVLSGFEKITGFEGTVGYIASRGLPLPQVAAAAAAAVELGGGILLIVGWQTRWAATALLLFTIPTTLIFHNFWAADAGQVQNQTIHFMKNLCIMGGMLYVMAFGAGPLSVDNRKS
jgi:putative oxidoreductase